MTSLEKNQFWSSKDRILICFMLSLNKIVMKFHTCLENVIRPYQKNQLDMNKYKVYIIDVSQMASSAVGRNITWESLRRGFKTGPSVLLFLFQFSPISSVKLEKPRF